MEKKKTASSSSLILEGNDVEKICFVLCSCVKAQCGWKDFKGWFGDKEEAASEIPTDQAYWFQVVDAEKWEIVAQSYNEGYPDDYRVIVRPRIMLLEKIGNFLGRVYGQPWEKCECSMEKQLPSQRVDELTRLADTAMVGKMERERLIAEHYATKQKFKTTNIDEDWLSVAEDGLPDDDFMSAPKDEFPGDGSPGLLLYSEQYDEFVVGDWYDGDFHPRDYALLYLREEKAISHYKKIHKPGKKEK